jgi:hypothetical protein
VAMNLKGLEKVWKVATIWKGLRKLAIAWEQWPHNLKKTQIVWEKWPYFERSNYSLKKTAIAWKPWKVAIVWEVHNSLKIKLVAPKLLCHILCTSKWEWCHQWLVPTSWNESYLWCEP